MEAIGELREHPLPMETSIMVESEFRATGLVQQQYRKGSRNEVTTGGSQVVQELRLFVRTEEGGGKKVTDRRPFFVRQKKNLSFLSLLVRCVCHFGTCVGTLGCDTWF